LSQGRESLNELGRFHRPALSGFQKRIPERQGDLPGFQEEDERTTRLSTPRRHFQRKRPHHGYDIIPSRDVLRFCDPSLSRDEKAALKERPTYYILDEIGKLDIDTPPFAVDAEPFLEEGFRIHPKGEIFINPAETVASGDIALVALDEDVFLKRVAFTLQGFELSSRSQSPIPVPGEFCLLDRFRILGKIVGAFRPIQGLECD
jgi:hypothetical protein